MSQVISRQALDRLIEQRLATDARVFGPCAVRGGAPAARRGSPDPADRGSHPDAEDLRSDQWLVQETGHSERCLYQDVRSPADLRLDAAVRPSNSIKELVFPRHETLFAYQFHGKQIELIAQEPFVGEQIVVGCRPCDAAALPILDHVFHWDSADPFYDARRRQTTIVTLACRQHDAHCFCTSVNLGPDDPRGSDAMLFDLGDNSYEVRCWTDKGRALFAGQTTTSDATGQVPPGPEKRLDMDAVGRFLQDSFDSPAWQSLSRRCLGCGACAYTCPTCHCFDMVDEGNAAAGRRVRNWDACQFAQFTAHASGHNPRAVQAQRQRQRILHKFQVYPQKFGDLLCTGCGNCTRNCPVRLGVRPVLEGIERQGMPEVENKMTNVESQMTKEGREPKTK